MIEESTFPARTTDNGSNILSGNPLFVDAPNGDFRLFSTSLAANTGNDAFVTEPLDLAGDARIQNGQVNMGAYETLAFTTITSFSPTSGLVGTEVTITGTGFDATSANNVVYFGATAASVTAASARRATSAGN